MTQDEYKTRRRISRMIREAALVFAQSDTPLDSDALSRMDEAISLAENLEDKVPLVICEANLASMYAVGGLEGEAFAHVERALALVHEHDLPVRVRNFACTKFIETGVLLGREADRVMAYAQGLLHSAVDEENSRDQWVAALFNLAVVADELFGDSHEALAIYSLLDEILEPEDKRIRRQLARARTRTLERLETEDADLILCDVEANRDAYLATIAGSYMMGRKDDMAGRSSVPESDDSASI